MKLRKYLTEDKEFAQYLFGQLDSRANDLKRGVSKGSMLAAEFADMTKSDKLKFFNEKVIPLYRKHRSPEKWSEELHLFIRNVFGELS
jgi:hypothetical protein